jgi:CheY-like chemotaxis protein
MRTIFTTTQAAKVCQVAPRTVTRWFGNGLLPGSYTVPSTLAAKENGRSGDRRIPREVLEQLMKLNGIPSAWLDRSEATDKLLLVGCSPSFTSMLSGLLPSTGYKIAAATSTLEAGMQTIDLAPDCVVIDFDLGCDRAMHITETLRTHHEYADVMIVALVESNSAVAGQDRSRFTDIWKKPFDVELFATRVSRMIGEAKHHS